MRAAVATALAQVVLVTVAAIWLASAGVSFMFELERPDPVLGKLAPVVEDPHTPRLARRVYLVIVDGLRLDRSLALPFFERLREHGVSAVATSHYPTWSRPNFVSILTGVPPLASGIRTNHHPTPVPLDSLMERAHAAGLRVATVSDYALLPPLFLRGTPINDAPYPRRGDVVLPPLGMSWPFDDVRRAASLDELGRTAALLDADLVIVLTGVVDKMGHEHGGDSPEYREAANDADRALAHALADVDLATDTIVVTSDHGHIGSGGHGGLEPEVVDVPLLLIGAGISQTVPRDAQLIDIAPTIAALLGIPAPGHALGRTLVESTTLDDAARAQRRAGDDKRHAALGPALGTSGSGSSAWRLALVAAMILAACALGVLLARQRAIRFEPRVLPAGLVAFAISGLGFIVMVGGRFSPSAVPTKAHLIEGVITYACIAVGVQLAASLWLLRGRDRRDRLVAANGLAFVGGLFATAPCALALSCAPADLPDPFELVVIPALELASACAAVAVALTLVIELVVAIRKR